MKTTTATQKPAQTLTDSLRAAATNPADYDVPGLLNDAAGELDGNAVTIRTLVGGIKASRERLRKEDAGFETWVALGELLTDAGFEEETTSEPTPVADTGEDVEF